jgi:hypothetical protein
MFWNASVDIGTKNSPMPRPETTPGTARSQKPGVEVESCPA